MQLAVGDKVRYLDDVGEATIIKILDAKTALVQDDFGLTHPHPLKQLVPADRDRVAEQKQVPPQPGPKTSSAESKPTAKSVGSIMLPELCLAFVSTNAQKPETGDLDLILVNNSSYHLLVIVSTKLNDEWFRLFHGEIAPGSESLIQALRRQDVGSVSNMNVDVIFFGTSGFEWRKPLSATLRIKPTKFVKPGNYQRFEGIENPAISIALEPEIPSAFTPPTTPSRKTFKNVVRPSLNISEEEVDLHLEAILGEDPRNMSDHEKFTTQMRHFERKLNHALTHKYVQITFIHGVGTGRLKSAIREELSEYGLSYSDGAFHKYGVGATVVNLNLI
jgi:hypothetical protein